jgi:hypothetical protein
LFSDSLVSLAEMETETLNVIELGARAWPGSNLELVLDWDPTLSSCLNVIELGIWSLCLIGIDHETWDLCLVVIYGKRKVILRLVLKSTDEVTLFFQFYHNRNTYEAIVPILFRVI